MQKFYDINSCLDWLYLKGGSKGKFNLDNIKYLLDKLDNPQDKIKVIHIAGTNGKGSTSNFLASVLSRKYKCGLFTSPYMNDITDSFKINGVQMSEKLFIKYINKLILIIDAMEKNGKFITYFEIITSIMYKYFYDQNVDFAVVEVGLGGKLDSTNIIKKPIASVIVTISKDHQNVLGNTIEDIAENKAGIIKNNCSVFMYPQIDTVHKIFEQKAIKLNCEFNTFSISEIDILKISEVENVFNFRTYKNMKSCLIGKHQVYNAALALTVIDYLKNNYEISEKDIYDGIYLARNTGRLEVVSKNPKIIFDGAHNKESIISLIDTINCLKFNRLIVGFSMLKDKDISYALSALSKISDELIVTTVDYPGRNYSETELNEIIKEYEINIKVISNNFEAFQYTKSLASEDDLILWCGSLYLIRELLKYLD
ncbi:bifunctional folylpolyglutamate synthase/dihydrofolate synthase [Helcococcus bovis]|uniref:tetrahydrofolate synthase n=1 Tax=Helcococcus bovis TaxID=3153252 RepID=A0ABW9F662_9FIRM